MKTRILLSFFLTSLIIRPAFATESFKLTSPQIAPGAKIAETHVYNGFGCQGKNLSPELNWSGAPAETKSFAVTVYDPDAPTGSGWWHWIVYDIPAGESGLASQYKPPVDKAFNPNKSVEYVNDFGHVYYGGPCPPPGDKPHRYIFSVHALKVDKLKAPAGASHALVRFMIQANTLAKAELMGYYGR